MNCKDINHFESKGNYYIDTHFSDNNLQNYDQEEGFSRGIIAFCKWLDNEFLKDQEEK